MAYSFQNFVANAVLTATQVNQLEENVRAHRHGQDNVDKVGIAHEMTTVTGSFSVSGADTGELFKLSTVTSEASITLPLPATLEAGWGTSFFNASSVPWRFEPPSGTTIDGNAFRFVTPQEFIAIGTDGLTYFTMNKTTRINSVHVFTTATSGTPYVKTPATNKVIVEVVGGGGGGGRWNESSTSPVRYRIGGGGGGGYATKIVDLTGISSVAVTVGAGGAGSAFNSTFISGTLAGGTGGTSSFGGYCSATGGQGAQVSGGTSDVVGRSGGVGIGGDLNVPGGTGMRAQLNVSGSVFFSGPDAAGGATRYGYPGNDVNSAGYGTGGTGHSFTAAANAGADGVVLVWEFS